jgi:phosphohistidine swiveling domain-containing protein
MKRYVHSLDSRMVRRAAVAGGKGANLHQLIERGYAVPPGFVISTSAFKQFLRANKLDGRIRLVLSTIAKDRSDTIVAAAAEIQSMLLRGMLPKSLVTEIETSIAAFPRRLWAVRSSAAVEDGHNRSWAGQFDTFLNVARVDVPERMIQCWASMFNARAISYDADAYGRGDVPRIAVVVQKMIAAEVSGVAFSVEPTRSNDEHMLIEAVHGLGDKLVSGAERSLAIELDKASGAIVKRVALNAEDATLLSPSRLRTLKNVVAGIEEHFGVPVDVEWSFGPKRLSVLQARPITTDSSTHTQSAPHGDLPDVSNYELTFQVAGLNFLFADVLAHAFSYLEPLLTFGEDGMFRQRFSNRRMVYAADFGVRWYAQDDSFVKYRREFARWRRVTEGRIDTILAKPSITKTGALTVLRLCSALLRRYSRMDNQFTNLAFVSARTQPAIRRNLKRLSKFKDVARVWVNETLIDEGSRFAILCDRISVQLNIERSSLERYSSVEFARAFDGDRVPAATLDARRQAYVIYRCGDKLFHASGERVAGYIRDAEASAVPSDATGVRGQVANGSTRSVGGVVRLINVDYADIAQMNREIDGMQKGEILVAGFTAPELLAACKKAAALVTDIGGLLSHAAIVSRELKIPCVVGTGVATKVFQTGDYVQIDFNSGRVMKVGAVER